MLSEKIKDDILNNVLPKGTPLRQAELSKRYGVSRIPIRDSLLALKAEGWLVPHGKAGLMVPHLNWKEAEELYLMRSQLEVLLLSFSFDFIKQKDMLKAHSILSILEKDELTLIEKGHLNWLFHEALYLPADKQTLQKTVSSINQQVTRYIGFQYGPMGYKSQSQQDHHELLTLIQLKKKSAALSLLKKHIEDAGEKLTTFLRSID
ncbi:putative HTH-type transcriptional regulator YdfH [Marinomonas spartinae]|uniref:Putative HTH-type transcriptional regulator YdfH n=1 Tax=Marinomonas spartinae TaxID=1792290 RepID=A0A1A8TN36_9GAMM|nr:GntR family transcriptional regulator [Marinomonas spartinae]SBS34585.1 putative HTH-type transcriptional regulator YdfH [Marinomonas spartinae]SBS38183.1 putative HTH-type transcriptional regulator YdfH [Marinomonas spartinae]